MKRRNFLASILGALVAPFALKAKPDYPIVETLEPITGVKVGDNRKTPYGIEWWLCDGVRDSLR